MPVFFSRELESVATYWRIFRTDGVALAFWSHNRDMIIDGIQHHGAPGMVPSAIKLTNSFTSDSAEVTGVLTHHLIKASEIEDGLYDHARIEVGAIDWNDLISEPLYQGSFGAVENDGLQFSVDLRSAKDLLESDLVPRTSPTCRAQFCDKHCGASAPKFTKLAFSSSVDFDTNQITVLGIDHARFEHGQLRFLEGPQTGTIFGISAFDQTAFVLNQPLSKLTPDQAMVELREGCDQTISTCRSRFANTLNFRGEPFLPGNDLLARYPRTN